MNPIPDEVREFILRYIKSAEELETLLLLRAERREWTPEEVSQRLFTQPQSAGTRLEELASKGFLQQESDVPRYRYAPLDPSLDKLVDQLARLYPTFRVRIIEMIFTAPGGRIQTFADVFKFRKTEEDNG